MAISNNLLHAPYGIYNDADGETTMTGHGRERARLGTDGRYGRDYMYMQHNLALSVLSASHNHKNISSPATILTRKKRAETERGRQERRGSHQRKQASGKRSSLYPSTRKGGREAFWFALVQENEEGGRTRTTKPPFLSLLSLNSVYCALFLWPFSCFLYFFLSFYILYSLFCKLPSSSECYCA